MGLKYDTGQWKWRDNTVASDLWWSSSNPNPTDASQPYTYLDDDASVIHTTVDGRRGYWCELNPYGKFLSLVNT